ncbi:hypothetical protein MTO96_002876 [Rhipicephalus appendiculatus]
MPFSDEPMSTKVLIMVSSSFPLHLVLDQAVLYSFRSKTRALTSGTMFLHPVMSHNMDVQRLRPLHCCVLTAEWICVHPVGRVPDG